MIVKELIEILESFAGSEQVLLPSKHGNFESLREENIECSVVTCQPTGLDGFGPYRLVDGGLGVAVLLSRKDVGTE